MRAFLPRSVTACWAAAVLWAGGLLPTATCGQDRPPENNLSELYRQARRAAIEVLVDDHLNGSGVFVDRSGLVLTAAHVVGRPGSRVEILTDDTQRRKADVVAVDLGHDLAILRAASRDGGFAFLPLASEPSRAGEDLWLVGGSVYRHAIMLRGHVAREGTSFEYCGDRYVEVVHVAATVQPGTSGGPWFNRRGEVVCVQSGSIQGNGVPIGVAFGGPAAAAQILLQTQRTAATPTFGAAVEETWQQQRDFLDRFPPRTDGLVVKVLRGDGPAARAGLKQWDVIIEADGKPMRLPDQLLRVALSKKPGENLPLTVLGPDGSGVRKATLQLGKLEVGWPEK